MARRQHLTVLTIIAVSVFVIFSFLLTFGNSEAQTFDVGKAQPYTPVGETVLFGEATAPKLENATLKAELGHSAWKVLHTMMAKFPDHPTEEDQEALKSYIYLFARLYPCGDCARHFQGLLEKYPPQTATRSTAATWACHVHNEVNKRLKKDLFDCSKIGDFYDCGCAEDPTPGAVDTKAKTDDTFTPLTLEKDESITRGG